MDAKKFETLLVDFRDGRCYATLNRPKARNALSGQMVDELTALFDHLAANQNVRILVLRGADGWFCAGGDIKQFQQVFQGELTHEQCAASNREIGTLLAKLNELPQTVVMLIEGAAIGGGFGLVCTSDVAIASAETRFSLTETTLGIPPAQIAAFVVQRIGMTQARRLMLTGARFKAAEAADLGLIHFAVEDSAALDEKAEEILQQIERCAPGANAITKEILHSTQRNPLETTLEMAAAKFATAMLSAEGLEGVSAFVEKRRPNWKK